MRFGLGHLSGVTTIRAFGLESHFLERALAAVDANHQAYLLLWAANRWLAVRVEFIGAFVTFLAGLAVVLGGRMGAPVDGGWAGLVLVYASMFTDVLMVSLSWFFAAFRANPLHEPAG